MPKKTEDSQSQKSRKVFDRIPAWADFESKDPDSFLTSIRLACSNSLIHAIRRTSGQISTDMAINVLTARPEIRSLARNVIAKVDLTDTMCAWILNSRNIENLRQVLLRPDVDSETIDKIARQVIESHSIYDHEMLLNIIQHANCSPQTVCFLWNSGNKQRSLIFHARQIPDDVQQEIMSSGRPHDMYKLMIHDSVRPEFRTLIAEIMLTSDVYEHVSDAVNYGDLSKKRLGELLTGNNLRTAIITSDRISELMSVLRVSAYTRHHAGISSPGMNSLLSDYIHRGLPLGWFVALCPVARKIPGLQPNGFLDLVKRVASQNVPTGLRSIAACSKSQFDRFEVILDLIPLNSRSRIIVNSIDSNQINCQLIEDLANISGQPALQGIIPHVRWKRIRNFYELHTYLTNKLEIKSTKNCYFRPHKLQSWSWLQILVGKKLDSNSKIVIPRSSHTLRRWAAELRNCLAQERFAGALANGKTLMLGVEKYGRIAYVAQFSSDGTTLMDIRGVNNCMAPRELTEAIMALIVDAKISVCGRGDFLPEI